MPKTTPFVHKDFIPQWVNHQWTEQLDKIEIDIRKARQIVDGSDPKIKELEHSISSWHIKRQQYFN